MIRISLRVCSYILMCNNMDTVVRRLLAHSLSSDQLGPTRITDSDPNTPNVSDPSCRASRKHYTEQDYIIREKTLWPILTVDESWTIFERLIKNKDFNIRFLSHRSSGRPLNQNRDFFPRGRQLRVTGAAERLRLLSSAFFLFCHTCWLRLFLQATHSTVF